MKVKQSGKELQTTPSAHQEEIEMMQFSDIGSNYLLCISKGPVPTSLNIHTTFGSNSLFEGPYIHIPQYTLNPIHFSSLHHTCSTLGQSSRPHPLPYTFPLTSPPSAPTSPRHTSLSLNMAYHDVSRAHWLQSTSTISLQRFAVSMSQQLPVNTPSSSLSSSSVQSTQRIKNNHGILSYAQGSVTKFRRLNDAFGRPCWNVFDFVFHCRLEFRQRSQDNEFTVTYQPGGHDELKFCKKPEGMIEFSLWLQNARVHFHR